MDPDFECFIIVQIDDKMKREVYGKAKFRIFIGDVGAFCAFSQESINITYICLRIKPKQILEITYNFVL